MNVGCAMLSQSADGHEGWGSDRLGTARRTKKARRLRIAATRLNSAC